MNRNKYFYVLVVLYLSIIQLARASSECPLEQGHLDKETHSLTIVCHNPKERKTITLKSVKLEGLFLQNILAIDSGLLAEWKKECSKKFKGDVLLEDINLSAFRDKGWHATNVLAHKGLKLIAQGLISLSKNIDSTTYFSNIDVRSKLDFRLVDEQEFAKILNYEQSYQNVPSEDDKGKGAAESEQEFGDTLDSVGWLKYYTGHILPKMTVGLVGSHPSSQYDDYNSIPISHKRKLYLGAMPIYIKGQPDRNFLAKMKEEAQIKYVLSMVEKFELQATTSKLIKIIPFSNKTFEAHGINKKQIASPDHHGVEVSKINQGVEFVRRSLDEDKGNVYVHCMAGIGRSASVVVGYLMKYEGLSFEEAKEHAQKNRPQVNLNLEQIENLKEFEKIHCKRSTESAKQKI